MKLTYGNLTPVFVDIETTGLDHRIHTILEIAVIVGDNEFTSCMSCDANDWKYADKDALEINGFNPECLWNGKTRYEVKCELEKFLISNKVRNSHAFFMCANPCFDRPFFMDLIDAERMKEMDLPYHWLYLASMFWIKYQGIFHLHSHQENLLSKDKIAMFHQLEPEAKPHRALQGAKHLKQCYEALLMEKPLHFACSHDWCEKCVK